MGRVFTLLGVGWAMAASLQLLLWRVSLTTRNAGIVDVGWACAFTVVTAIFIIAGPAPGASWGPIAGVVVVWSLRLCAHLVERGELEANHPCSAPAPLPPRDEDELSEGSDLDGEEE